MGGGNQLYSGGLSNDYGYSCDICGGSWSPEVYGRRCPWCDDDGPSAVSRPTLPPLPHDLKQCQYVVSSTQDHLRRAANAYLGAKRQFHTLQTLQQSLGTQLATHLLHKPSPLQKGYRVKLHQWQCQHDQLTQAIAKLPSKIAYRKKDVLKRQASFLAARQSYDHYVAMHTTLAHQYPDIVHAYKEAREWTLYTDPPTSTDWLAQVDGWAILATETTATPPFA